jgi:hypothetical protein
MSGGMTHARTVLRFGPALAVAWLLCSVARGQAPSSMAEAESRFSQGEQHAERQEWALALEAFEDVHRYLEGVGHPRRALVLYDVAVCLQELGRDRDAVQYYERFLAEAPPDATHRAEAQQALRELRARASLDGSSVSPIGIVIASAGGAAVIAGGLLGIVALTGRDEIASMCTAEGLCPAALEDRAHEIQLLAGVADGLLFGGLAVAAIGIVLTFVLGTDGSDVRASAAMRPGGAMFALGGSF